MFILNRLFSGKRRNNRQSSKSEEYNMLLSLRSLLDDLTSARHYVARSEYQGKIDRYKETVNFFNAIITGNLLDEFCKKNAASKSVILKTIEDYENIIDKTEQSNEKYVVGKLEEEKSYLDTILHDIDAGIVLDEDQRRVVLCDEDYTLVIAGAGAGKSTTIAAKVKYLVERQNIAPEEILVISFTNKAVNELKEKINRDLKIPCPIATFHSTGNAVLHKKSPENLNIADEGRMYWCLMEYMKDSVLQNKKMVDSLILFFASYFDAPFTGRDINEFFYKISRTGYATLKSDLDEVKEKIIDSRSKKCVTIQNELLRSKQEVEIANYLYLNNIEYQYETVYPYNLQGSRKPYTPDFLLKQGELTVYLEHFGISEAGENFLYSKEQLEAYKNAVNQKIRLHRNHGTKLIYTFACYNDKRPLLEHLKEELVKSGFELRSKKNEEVLRKIIASEENRYIRKLVFLMCRFITNFKTNGYAVEEFDRMYYSTENVRSRLFLSICRECFLHYERWLAESNAIDFQDMINRSAKILREAKENQDDLGFRYIIVDEYQDISRQRFDLTKALSEATKARIMAVGDDWQSIYAFSGSDITLFTEFAEKVGYARQLQIVKTYRNSQEVIDIAGNFVQKNMSQIRKRLISPKNISEPVIIYTYDPALKRPGQDNRSGVNYAIAHAVEIALEQITVFNKAEGQAKGGTVLLLGRFGFDGERLEKSGLFEYISRGGKVRSVKYPEMDITYMTAHSSKGLGYDNVIVVNGRNETYGFPSQIEDDPVLSFVIREDRSIEYAEERRLFYVAMTRTKNRVFFIAPEQNPSEFLLELKRDYKNVVLKGEWNEEEPVRSGQKVCPLCGFPLQLRYKKSYGLRLYLCTNEPELCSFMTNDLTGGKMSVMKCDECQSGYLIVKKSGTENRFLGCTNYNKQGTGCKKTLSKIQYYKMMHYNLEKENLAYEEKKQDKIRVSEERVKNRGQHYQEIEKKEITINSKYNIREMNDCLYIALTCLNHMSEKNYYGKDMLLDILQGSMTPDIAKNGLQNLPEYGYASGTSRQLLDYIVEWLIEKEFIFRTRGRYPVLHPAYNGLHYSEKMTDGMLRQLVKELEQRSRRIQRL